jgi:hypothetical protein
MEIRKAIYPVDPVSPVFKTLILLLHSNLYLLT